jgi:predicted nucleic acid-binding protein
VTLCDTDPLVALVDRDAPYHQRCVAALNDIEKLVSTWPCFTEAMHLLRRGGHRAQETLWGYWADGLLELHTAAQSEWGRMRALMRQYRDAPMDLADASLVTAAEHLGLRRIFTVDGHFRAYRIDGKHAFEILPE